MLRKFLALFNKCSRRHAVNKSIVSKLDEVDAWDDYNPDSNKMF
tara:strand:+ start:281 stop:412 length:132 start_codon:yes stop_codon:yes gene_type:complete